jgi:competence protein ComEA
MNRFRKITDYLFGYNRREKRATITLVVILIALFFIRYFSLPRERPEIFVTLSGVPGLTDTASVPAAEPLKMFAFNPNTVTKTDLLRLGFSSRQASTFLSYRNTGARFRQAGDLGKVFGISEAMVKALTPYVIIEDEKNVTPDYSGSGNVTPTKRANTAPEVCLVELNSCTAEDLLKLPGIGEVLSGRIIRFRDLLGGFVSTEQLGEVYGIDTSVISELAGRVYVNTDSVRKISIDTCCYKTLARHPYIGPAAARSILKYRKLIGPPSDIGELVRQKVIDSLKASRMAPYCSITPAGTEGTGNAAGGK